ncbi:MAG: 1-acyl-sn-glycerol-3-phosphate acyltransferase [Bacteroidales bacterium]|nr:1-acyl-sn-glycerol-3-phosphate acyltransferase [Bacteroidales bacterium]
MKKWSFFYEVVRFFVRLIHDWFYRRIIIRGKKHIPQNKPVVFAPNHQNALMDPLAIIFTNKLQTVFLTRSDVFKKFLVPVFSFLKMLPVYRIRDGAESLKNNEIIFEKSVEILESGMSMALFPEALHFGKRSLRPLKKAIPRIVFQAEEKNLFNADIQIIPTGIYYDNYTDSNSLLQVNYGKPIAVKKFKAEYEVNPQRAMLQLRDAISEGIKPLIIHIQDLENYDLYEDLRHLLRKRMARKTKTLRPNQNWFKIDKKTIERIENLPPAQFDTLKNLHTDFLNAFNETGLYSLEIRKSNWLKFILNSVLLVIGFPVFLFALLNTGIPYFLLKQYLNTKIKDPQFHSSLKFGFGLFVLPVYYLLISLIPFFILNGHYFTYFLLLVITGLTTVKYKLLYRNTRLHWGTIRARLFKQRKYRKMIRLYYEICILVGLK